MSYGIIQEYYYNNWTLEGDRDITGVIGTTSNGVMYLSMPFVFALFTQRWARKRQSAALCGTVLACVSFVLSSYSTNVWHLVATQEVTSAFGCALIYSPTTLSLGEWFATSNRALAYGITLSCKNVVDSICPFLFRAHIDRYDFRIALRAWTAILAGSSILGVFLTPTHPSRLSSSTPRARKIPWHFLKYRAIYIYGIAIMFQSSGYGIPQSYLSTYARDILLLSQTSGTLMLTLFNAPGIALCAFPFWGLTTQGGITLLIVFSIIFGFFSIGYSATWGGMLNEIEGESAERNEAIDSGMLYGLLNGMRAIGYVGGGVSSVLLLKGGYTISWGKFGYGTTYGPLILFTGLSSIIGGWCLLWDWKRLLQLL